MRNLIRWVLFLFLFSTIFLYFNFGVVDALQKKFGSILLEQAEQIKIKIKQYSGDKKAYFATIVEHAVIGKNGYVYILNGQGVIVNHSDKARVGLSINNLDSTRNVQAGNSASIIELDETGKVMMNKAYVPLENEGVYLVVAQPVSEIVALARPLQASNALLLLMIAMFVFLVVSAAKETQGSEQKFRTIFDTAKDAIFWTDYKSGAIISCNKAATALLGKSKNEILGTDHSSFFPPAKRQQYVETFDRNLRDNLSIDMETEVMSKDGQNKPVHITGAVANVENKRIVQVIVRDITERKRLEALKDEFLGTVSHELRTPLTTIREAVSQVLDGILGETTPDQKEFLSLCLIDIDRLVRIINGLLDISKLEAGKVEIHRSPVDIVALVKGVGAFFHSRSLETGVEVRVKTPDEPIEVYIDRDRIIQVVTNLVGNAFKFTEKGYIEISLEYKENFIECSVADTGKGIPEKDYDKVFDKFKQLDRVEGPGEKGTGLGLSIAKGIVELHGGDIWVKSAVGQGSVFTFTLPRYDRDGVLCDSIEEGITAARVNHKGFSLFIVRAAIKDESNHNIFINFNEILLKLERSLKHGEYSTLIGENEIVITAELSKEEAFRVKAQLKRLIWEFMSETDSVPDFNLSFGLASFPEDSDTGRGLLKKAQQSILTERDERLKKTIMLVDDEIEVVELLQKQLGRYGYENVTKAYDGTEALQKVADMPPDLILLDLHMPHMSGYEVIGRLKEDATTQDIPIIIVSGHKVDPGKFKDYGTTKAIPMVTKPIDMNLVLRWIEYLL